MQRLLREPSATPSRRPNHVLPSAFNEFLRRYLRNGPALMGSVIVGIVLIVAVLASVVARYDPLEMFMVDRLRPPGGNYLLGTDHLGRDVFSRVVWGARLSMRVATVVALFTTAAGLLIGALAGYYSHLDNYLMRVMDALMAFPAILLAISIMGALGRSEVNVMIALSIVYTPGVARIVRGAVLATKNHDYVEAARAMGALEARVLFRHVLPNARSLLVVQGTFIYVYSILAESGLSFVGAGTPPTIPSWGNMLAEGRSYMVDAPWIMLFPGLAIAITVLGLNLVGDGLRDLLDPRLRK